MVKHETSCLASSVPAVARPRELAGSLPTPSQGGRQGLVGAYDQARPQLSPDPTPALATFGPHSRGHRGSPRATQGAGLCPDAPGDWAHLGRGAGAWELPEAQVVGPAQESHWPNLGDPVGGRGEGRTCRAGLCPPPMGPSGADTLVPGWKEQEVGRGKSER